MSHSWQGDWHARILKKVESLGFADVTAFARIHPRKTFEELARELGRPDPDIAPIQVQWVLYEEASQRKDMISFAKDCLVRYLRQRIPHGWGQGDNFWSHAAGAYARWKNAMEDSYAEHAERAWRWLKVQDIPKGWLPEGPDDPWIDAMFRETGFPGVREPGKEADGVQQT